MVEEDYEAEEDMVEEDMVEEDSKRMMRPPVSQRQRTRTAMPSRTATSCVSTSRARQP